VSLGFATDDLVASSFRLQGTALERYRSYAGDGVFRLSVGLEEPEDIIEDLDRVLEPSLAKSTGANASVQ